MMGLTINQASTNCEISSPPTSPTSHEGVRDAISDTVVLDLPVAVLLRCRTNLRPDW
jgi:hypothetical protein